MEAAGGLNWLPSPWQSRQDRRLLTGRMLAGRKLESLACFAAGMPGCGEPAILGGRYSGPLRRQVQHRLRSGDLDWPRHTISIPARFTRQLYDGFCSGGTRYMPLFFVLHSLVARLLGGDYVLSGKLLSLVVVILLISLTFVILRRFHVPRSFALLLALLVCSQTLGLKQDRASAPTLSRPCYSWVPSLWLLIWAHDSPFLLPHSRRLAVFTKLSALWAPAAIALWLFRHNRREFLLFAASFIGFVVASAFAVQIVSDGRFLENLATMAFAGVDREFAIQKSTSTCSPFS